MIRSRHSLLFILASFLLMAPSIALLGVEQARAQDGTPVAEDGPSAPPLAEAMPANTAAYAAITFDPDSDQSQQLSALAAQLVLPGAGDTMSAIVEQITQLLVQIPTDLATVLTGEVGAAVLGPESSEDGLSLSDSLLPGYAIVLHPAEAGRARQAAEKWFNDRVTDHGGEVEQTRTGSALVIRDKGNDEGERVSPAVMAFAGDYIFLGNDADSLTQFIDASQGSAPSMAESEELQTLNAALPSERLLFGYLESAALLELVGSFEFASLPISSIEPPFGPTAFSVAADHMGLRLESVSIPLSESERSLFDRDDDDENPSFASHVPDSTLAMYAGQNLGDSWLMAQVQKVLLSVLAGSLGVEADLEGFSPDEQFGFLSMLSGINFKTDVFEQLKGDYGTAIFSLDTEDPAASSAVIASDLATPDVVRVAVTSLGPLIQSAGSGTASVTTTSIDDQTVNNVALSTDLVDATLQYGVVDDQLMIGLGGGIATLATAPSAPLSESEAYLAALAELPERYDSVTYLDVQALSEQLVPLVLETLAEDSNNSIVKCLAEVAETDDGTPEASEIDSDFDWIVDLACPLVNGLLGGDSALLDLVLSRVPGPFVAVSYDEGDLHHVSGILMVGSAES